MVPQLKGQNWIELTLKQVNKLTSIINTINITTCMSLKLRSFLHRRATYFYSEGSSGQSYYRRALPERLITLDSLDGKQIFKQALTEGHCESFFTLVQQFITQSQVSTCSSATLAMILNSLKVDPGINWKGIWRWYDDYNIKHMHPKKIAQGLTLQEFNSLALLNSVRSLAFSPLEQSHIDPPPTICKSSLTLFRNCLISCATSNDSFMTVNFNRKILGQTGTGHYSPIAGYNARRDMALILDVAKFKYDSYWCSLPHLYQALKPLDAVSRISRGFIINKKQLNEQTVKIRHHYSERDIAKINKIKATLGNGRNLLQKTLKIVNDQSLHNVLVPILYEYATNSVPQIDQVTHRESLKFSSQQIIDQTVNNKDLLQNQAIFVLQAFKKTTMKSVFQFLLVLFHFRTNPQDLKQSLAHNTENMQKTLVLFQTMLSYLDVSRQVTD